MSSGMQGAGGHPALPPRPVAQRIGLPPFPTNEHHQPVLVPPFPAGLPPSSPASELPSLRARLPTNQQQQMLAGPIASLFPSESSLVDQPADASKGIPPLFPGIDQAGAAVPSSTSPGPAVTASFLGSLRQWSSPAPTSASPAAFPGFAEFGIRHALAVPPAMETLGDSEVGVGGDHEQHTAALDAEAFLNSIQDLPSSTLDARVVCESSSIPVFEAQQLHKRSNGPVLARPRYNPVATYNPLAARGPAPSQ